MLAFSTCWNSGRHIDGAAMLQEIRELGFEQVELGHGTRISLLDGILKVVEAGEIHVCSLHNFCPMPLGLFEPMPNVYQFSARSELEWECALGHTRNTINFAARLGASVVVLHSGSVPMGKWTRKLARVVESGGRDKPRYERLLAKALAQRARHQSRHFAQTIKSFHALVPYAAEHRVKLGIETRFGVEEIPNESELEEILRLFPGETVGYWHDSGHAQVRENLGLGTQLGWLERFSKRLIGFHLHDTAPPVSDHRALGDGGVDFDRLVPFMSEEIPLVLEFSPEVPAEKVSASVGYLEALLRRGSGRADDAKTGLASGPSSTQGRAG